MQQLAHEAPRAKNFYGLSIEKLQQLVDQGFASAREKHNEDFR